MRQIKLVNRLVMAGITAFSFVLIVSLLLPSFAQAANIPTSVKAKISFTFDDGLASAYSQAGPILNKYGLTGTNYVITSCVGMTIAPNTCRANTDNTYMSWPQIQALQNSMGWEIGSHTVSHPCLASNAKVNKDDCQTATLTQAQVNSELSTSQAALTAKGIKANSFSAPYGDYNNMVLAQIAKYYTNMRGFQDQNNNSWPYSDYLVNDYIVLQSTTTLSMVKAKIDLAIANKHWLVLTFHDIKTNPSAIADDYQYSSSQLDQIAAYVKAKQTAGLITSTNINNGLTNGSPNLLAANSSFNQGISAGWTTDDPAYITKNTANNGSYPDATNSIKLASNPSAKNTHLRSPKVLVNSNTTYLLKNFLNVQTITSGAVGFYIDEFNLNGQWISGQYLKQETSPFVESLNFSYTPSSPSVSNASLQVIVAGRGITAYLDNTQWYAFQTTVPVNTNLMANGSFDSGMNAGWKTDSPTTIIADILNHGSPNNSLNSIKLVSSTKSTHLFSPLLSVSFTYKYSIYNWINIININSGEIAFYIDEYNASNQWISGQYKASVYSAGTSNVDFAYSPSSSSVTKASLQVIVVGNSGITAYLDDVRWYKN